jgi:carboxypeptidase Q
MTRARRLAPALALCLLASLPAAPARAEEPVDLDMVNRIRDEGFHRSQVMDTLFHLTDVLGPRLTGSPGQRAASEWARRRLESWGLENARLEPYEFGLGWSFRRSEVRMTAPSEALMPALPKAWTPGTAGPVRGEAIRADLEDEEDFEKVRGKLAGKVVLLDEARDRRDATQPTVERWTDKGLVGLGAFEIPEEPSGEGWPERARKRWERRLALDAFLAEEGALATLDVSSRDNGVIRISSGGSWRPGETARVPQLVMAAEPYHRILRLLDKGQTVELELDIEARFHDDDPNAHNTLAEIPGTDLRDEVVLLGAHLDSWHGGTGATDDAAGCAVVMEAARILKALGVRPRRTLRVALWTGEEQGIFGSYAYVEKHLATRPEPTEPEAAKLPRWLRDETWPITPRPAHARFAGYFNLDNGGGRIRGIYTQGNAAVAPIFRAWLAPFADLGATTVTTNDTGGTDHLPFDQVGLPGFQFIQDEMDYGSVTHHTDQDTYDHVEREDLMRSAVILASFAWHAANREEPLPRKPMPRAPAEAPAAP